MSTTPEKIKQVESITESIIGDELVISVFGLHKMTKVREQLEQPLAKSLAKVWLADRYVVEEEDEIIHAGKVLFPFGVNMDLETLESWSLGIGDQEPMPVPHPGTVILNYLTRSISGLRPKDSKKIDELARNVFTKSPYLVDWIIDGPGKSQLELARILHTLREPKKAKTLTVGERLEVIPYKISSLTNHAAMLLREDQLRANFALSASRRKARILHALESNQRLLTLHQRYTEQRMGSVISNK